MSYVECSDSKDPILSKNSESDIFSLQASIRVLVKERRELQSQLGNYENKRWNTASRLPINQSSYRGLKRTRQNPSNQVDTNVSETDNVEKSEDALTADVANLKTAEFHVEKRPKVDLDDFTIKRTKNIFGSLLGHLQKAKTRLDSEKTQRPAELQRAATEHVAHILELEKKNIAELKKRDFQDRQQKNLARMRELQEELRLKEAKILLLSLNNHFSIMKNFLRTNALPMIFWLPAHHNDETRQIQENTAEQIDNKLEVLKKKYTELVEDNWPPVTLAELDYFLSEEHQPVSQENIAVTIDPTSVHPDLINDSDDDDEDEDNIDEEKIEKVVDEEFSEYENKFSTKDCNDDFQDENLTLQDDQSKHTMPKQIFQDTDMNDDIIQKENKVQDASCEI